MSSPGMINRILPGAMPGKILVGGQEVDLNMFTEDWIFDSEVIPLGTAITAQQTIRFFSNLNHQLTGVRKLPVETSLTEPNRLPQLWNAIIKNIHFGFRPGSVNRVDAENIMQSAHISFILGNQRIERAGPMWLFPMPYGLSGPLALDGAGVATEVSEFQNGAVAKSAVGQMLPIQLPGNFAFEVRAEFDFPFTAVANINLYCVLASYISKPLM